MELPGRCGDWLDTATVTVQGSCSGSTRRARGGDFYLATSGDFLMATCGDFLMATDRLVCDAHQHLACWELRGWLRSLTAEAMVNACGVAVAISQEHSWAPHLLIGMQ